MARIAQYSPLRYPGGKGKLFPFVRELILHNNLTGGGYAEPYAGGANVALALLIDDYVSEIYINDIDYGIYSLWYSIVNNTDELMRRIWDTPVTMEEWQKQKAIERQKNKYSCLEAGFSTFFLNRTNRSGVIKAGVIGGNDQTGNYKIDARYNKRDLIDRINNIAIHAPNIHVSNKDCIDFLKNGIEFLENKGLVFLDPPYYGKGKQLYTSFYNHGDHVEVAKIIKNNPSNYWIVTYDNAKEIKEIYNRDFIEYNIGYSASHTNQRGTEVLFYSDSVKIPEKFTAGAFI